MQLEWLRLEHFRNYPQLFLDGFSETNVFFGKNAQGKTNLLESIYLLATLQTLRPAANKDLVAWEKETAYLEGKLSYQDIHRTFSVQIHEKSKRPKINDKSIKKTKEYFGLMNVISFSPLDLQTLQGPPQNRRRYLDRALFHFDPMYAQEIGRYMRALIQRNAALKLEQGSQIEIWGEKLIQSGAYIVSKRLQFIEKLNTLTPCLYQEISGLDGAVEVRYEAAVSCPLNVSDEETIRQILSEEQRRLAWQERKFKRSLVGPHRDEFSMYLNEKNFRNFGSQGEQRTAILALKLSELEALKREKGIKPIFLLDDIASELDTDRRNFLFQSLRNKNVQVFVTTTDPENVNVNKNKAKMYKVHQGSVTEV